MKAHLSEPAAAPNPMTGNRVDEQGDAQRVQAVCGELGTLCHRTGDNGCRGRTEYRLENQECKKRNAIRQNRRIISANHRIQFTAGTEHQAEANQPEYRCTDGKVHQVLHQDVAGVLRTGKTGLAHGKACLHEEHQSRTEQNPYGVYR